MDYWAVVRVYHRRRLMDVIFTPPLSDNGITQNVAGGFSRNLGTGRLCTKEE